jgi:hypothetical protein
MVFKLLVCLVKEKNNYKASACGFETLIIKIVLKAVANFCSRFPCPSLVGFLQCIFMAGFQNNYQDHRRLSEQLLF